MSGCEFFRDSLAKRRKVVSFSQSSQSQDSSDEEDASGSSSEEEFSPAFSQLVPYSQQTLSQDHAALLVMASQQQADTIEEHESEASDDGEDSNTVSGAEGERTLQSSSSQPRAQAELPPSAATPRTAAKPNAGADAIAPPSASAVKEVLETAGFTASNRQTWPNTRLLDCAIPSPDGVKAWLHTVARRQLQVLAKSLRLDARRPTDELRREVHEVFFPTTNFASRCTGNGSTVPSHKVWLRAATNAGFSSTVGTDGTGRGASDLPSEAVGGFPVGTEIILGRGRFGVTCEKVSRCHARLETSFSSTRSARAEQSCPAPGVEVWLSVMGRYDCLRVVRDALGSPHLENSGNSQELGNIRPTAGDRIQLFHGDAIGFGVHPRISRVKALPRERCPHMLILDLSQCCTSSDGTVDDRFAPVLEPVAFVARSAGSEQPLPLLRAGQKTTSVASSGAEEDDSPPVSPNGSPTVTLRSRRVVQRLKRQERAAMEKTAAEVCH